MRAAAEVDVTLLLLLAPLAHAERTFPRGRIQLHHFLWGV